MNGATRLKGLYSLNCLFIISVMLGLCSCQAKSGHSELNGVEDALQWKSVEGYFVVLAEPVVRPIPMNKSHSWKLTFIKKPPGQQPKLSLSGGMVGHSHGLPSSPELKWLNDNTLAVLGLRFHMSGPWFLTLALHNESYKDVIRIVFDV